VETSHPLQSVQEQTLKPFVEEFGWSIQWHDNLDAITPADKQYTMVLAHEFFDALPFHLIEVSVLSSNNSDQVLNVVEISTWMARDQNWLKFTQPRDRDDSHTPGLNHCAPQTVER